MKMSIQTVKNKLFWFVCKPYQIFQSIFHEYGYKSFFIFINRSTEYLYCIFFKRNKFIFNNKQYKYFYHFYNTTFRKERVIEIPITIDFIKKNLNKQILEVGNVLNHYYKFKHDVVDKFEVYPGVINEDIATYNPKKKYDLIISISTLEHIGWDENPSYKTGNTKEKNKTLKVLTHLREMLKNKGKLLVSFPIGYNKYLDELLSSKKLNFFKIYCMKRISKDNKWQQVNFNEVKRMKYGYPFQNANALIIGILKNY